MGFLLGLPWHLGYVGGIQDLVLVILLSLNRIGFMVYPKTTLTSLTVNPQWMDHDPIFRIHVVTSPTQKWNAHKLLLKRPVSYGGPSSVFFAEGIRNNRVMS